MIDYGFPAYYKNAYENNVKFAKENNFNFLQIWYDQNGISIGSKELKKESVIKKYNFPTIIHAVLDITDIDAHISKLIKISKFLNHKEIIIHPICRNDEITKQKINKLSDKIKYIIPVFLKNNVKLYLENNSKLNPIFSATEEIEIIYKENPDLEFVLDIAHINDYEHLKQMINIKYPKILHVTDKHFNIIHEHIPIGTGDLDFNLIFKNILKNFTGKIVIEIVDYPDLIKSKNYLDNILNINNLAENNNVRTSGNTTIYTAVPKSF